MIPSASRLPPGQQLAAPGKWPIIGEKSPASVAELGHLEIAGLVHQPRSWSAADLLELPQSTLVTDIHCVTRWSILDMTFSGVLLRDLLDQAKVQHEAQFVSFIANSARGHSSSLPLSDALACQTLIALTCHDKPLGVEHGGPIRNIVPGRYFYKSVKWLARIELLSEDRMGFWEAESGYHNTADPMLEQRYMAPTIDRRTAQRLIESRDFSQQDLRSIDASGRNLNALRASGAQLRDADFRGSQLRQADLSRANLSNAHFEEADLRDALFVHADVEGANFSGADLRGANFTGASLIGCSFCEPTHQSGGQRRAVIDPQTTIIPRDLWEPLSPEQVAFLNQSGVV